MSLEQQELEYQRTHADPVRGWIGLGCVALLVGLPVGFIVWLVWLSHWMACQGAPQFCG